MTDIWDDNGNRLPAQKKGEVSSVYVSFPSDGAVNIPGALQDKQGAWHLEAGREYVLNEPLHVPTPGQYVIPEREVLRLKLAGLIQDADAVDVIRSEVKLPIEFARAILAALQEVDRRELQATIDGDMPCG